MKKLKTIFALPALSLLLAANPAIGQTMQQSSEAELNGEPWSLERCIQYALDHSLTLQQQRLQVEQQEIQLNTARNSRLPQVSGSAGESLSFGRGLTADNTYSNTNTTSTSLNLGVSVPVFQGFQISNTIKMEDLNLKAITAEFEKAREDMSMSVTEAYVQVLYNMEILDVSENQVSIDSMQVERLTAMMENGKASKVEVAQQKAALGQSRLSATQARNNLNLSVLTLSQLLELDSPDGFTIVRPQVDVENLVLRGPEDIYTAALGVKPSIEAGELRLDAAEYTIKNAKAARLPSISASGGLGTNYYTTSGASMNSFGDQLKNNFSQSLGLTLSVPIFSGFQTRNQIRQAELSRTNYRIELENTKKSLYKEIQQAWLNASSAQESYRASIESRESAKESFDLVLGKYENGLANITEFNESRDAFLEAESNLSRARYELLYSVKLLDFYAGEPLKF